MRISGVAGSALNGNCLVDAEDARIGEADRLRLFLDDDAAATMIVGNLKLAVNLLHAEKDHSAIRIGERAIRLPKGIGQPAGCILAFGMDHLALLYKPLDLSCC